MINNVAILFYLKKRTNSQEEKIPVYVRITYDGQRTKLATGQKIQPKFWNSSEERAKGKSEAIIRGRDRGDGIAKCDTIQKTFGW